MPPATNEEQFRFLISCIRWSNNGKVDFTEVAKECQVVSKGAAAKRYERMMRAHGIHPNGGPVRAPTARQPKTERNAGPTPTKKSKNKAAAFEDMNVDDEEEPSLYHGLKSENSQEEELLVVKSEADQESMKHDGINDFQYMQSHATSDKSSYSMADNGYQSGNNGYTTPVAKSYGMAHPDSFGLGGSSDYGYSPRSLARQDSPSDQLVQYLADPIVITD